MLFRTTGVFTPRRALASVLTCLIGLVLFSSASAATSAAASGTSVVYFGTSSWTGGTSNLPKYGNVVMSIDKHSLLAGIRSANPSARVTGYKSAIEMVDDCGNMLDTCRSAITYQQALAHDNAHPDDPWVLRNASGASIVAPSYPNAHLANVGSASYQQQWIANVASVIKKYGFDGVYIDSVLGQISGWSGNVLPSRYPSEAAWEGAIKSFVAAVGPALKNQGLYVLANAYKAGPNDGSANIAWYKSIAPYLSGIQAEYFEQAGSNKALYDTNPCCWTGHWLSHLGQAAAVQDAGADFFAGMKGSASETGKMTYGYASFLLVWNGSGGGFFWQSSDHTDPYNPATTTDIGTPEASRYQVGVGWRRQFSAGTALVNPHYSSSQTFDLGGSYLTPSGSTVTSVTLSPVSAMVLRSTGGAPVAPAPAPANTSLPTISGGVQVGQSLSATVGSWSASPTSYAYQWRRCDTGGNACASIAGATASSYQLASGDSGSTIRVNVSATNAAGSGSASSNATAVVVTPAPPVQPISAPANTSLPTISGGTQVGQSVSAGVGSWSGSPTGYAYQWRRCDTGGNACASIAGATASSYSLASGDSGSTIRVNVSATNAAGSGSASSNATAVVVTPAPPAQPVSAPANMSLPTVSGSAQVGQSLSVGTGSWSGNPTRYSYQWRRCNSKGDACASVVGANASSFLLTSTDSGYTIRVNVFATNAAGTTWMNSNPTAKVAAAAAVTTPANTSLPTISGTAKVGQSLGATAGSWSGSPTSFTYYWRRCNKAGNACATVPGANASSYLLTSADSGSTIRVNVFATNAAGTTWMNSNSTAVVQAG